MLTTKVVILNWNGADFLRRFLPFVLRGLPEWASVVVADNGSTDASQGVVSEYFAGRVEWLPLDDNYGYAGGYNRALAQLEAEVFVLLNSDVEPAEGWLEPLVGALEREPRLAAVQPKICAWSDRKRFEYAGAAGGELDIFGYPFCRGRVLTHTELDHGQYDTPKRIFWASGACMAVRSEAFWEVGGLDADFFAHMEEIDLCWRMQLAGYQVGAVPESVVYHVGGGTLPNGSPRKIYLNFRNSLAMMHKCLPTGGRWRLCARRALDWCSAMVYLLSGRRDFAREVVRAHRDYRKMRSELDAKRRAIEAYTVTQPTTIYKGSVFWVRLFGKRER